MTSGQFRSHFFRQKKGRLQIGHVFCGKSLFFIGCWHVLGRCTRQPGIRSRLQIRNFASDICLQPDALPPVPARETHRLQKCARCCCSPAASQFVQKLFCRTEIIALLVLRHALPGSIDLRHTRIRAKLFGVPVYEIPIK